MQTQTKLIKTIGGQECEIYAVSHHRRLKVGKAGVNIEIYENSTVLFPLSAQTIYAAKLRTFPLRCVQVRKWRKA